MQPYPPYRLWTRNYNFSLGRMIVGWHSLELSLKWADISTCTLTMTGQEFIDNWDPNPTDSLTWLSNKQTENTSKDIGTGIFVWRGNDIKPIFTGPMVDFHRTYELGGDDLVELTFESDTSYLKRRLVLPDCGGTSQNSCNYTAYPVRPTSDNCHNYWAHQWYTTDLDKAPADTIMKWLVSANCADKADSAAPSRMIGGIDGDAYSNIMAVDADTAVGYHTTYETRMKTVFEACQELSRKEVTLPSDETGFSVGPRLYTCLPVDGKYLQFRTYLPRDKRTTLVFSTKNGTIRSIEYQEHIPDGNYMYVAGPGTDATQLWDIVPTTRTDVGRSVDMYGPIEISTSKSDTDYTAVTPTEEEKADMLQEMRDGGYADLLPSLFNVQMTIKIQENTYLKLSADGVTGCSDEELMPTNYFIGDYVRVLEDTMNWSLDELIRQIDIKVDPDGEDITCTIGMPLHYTKDWYSAMTGFIPVHRQLGNLRMSKP